MGGDRLTVPALVSQVNYAFVLEIKLPPESQKGDFPLPGELHKAVSSTILMSLLSCVGIFAMRLTIFAAIFLKSALAALYTDPSGLPNTPYTYIIVGGTTEHPRISSAL